eukprot:SAG31_NODE_5829_length_2306_cov_1.319891_3_plen_157_part_00
MGLIEKFGTNRESVTLQGKFVAGKGEAKTSQKTNKNEKKRTRRQRFATGVGGGEEVEGMLADIETSSTAPRTSVAPVVELLPRPPSSRINFSCVTVGTEAQPEMIIFGGEVNDGKTVTFYRDLCVHQRLHRTRHRLIVCMSSFHDVITAVRFWSCE